MYRTQTGFVLAILITLGVVVAAIYPKPEKKIAPEVIVLAEPEIVLPPPEPKKLTPPDPEEVKHRILSRMVQDAVKAKLKSPSTATFPDFKFGGVGTVSLVVESYVDSHNSFGGMMRTHFTVLCTRKDGKWNAMVMTLKQQ